jgi:transposase
VWFEALVIGGIHRKIQAAHTKLSASRAFMVVAYPSQSHEMLFDAHTRAFTALGGDRQAWHLGNRSCVATSCIHAVVRQHENRRAQGLKRQ